ncbi:MAG: hypothetical protein QOG15_2334 [Solirubrobacteraceae bacterium]|nr:hypothetical protein [Solirubrobacteraceae bacterium]
MKKLLVLAIAAAAILAVPALAATRSVTVGDNFFVHKTGSHSVTIKKNDTVKWTWTGHKKHNVYEVSQPSGAPHFHSPTHKGSGTFKHKFSKKGTYKFICSFENMKLTVKVN